MRVVVGPIVGEVVRSQSAVTAKILFELDEPGHVDLRLVNGNKSFVVHAAKNVYGKPVSAVVSLDRKTDFVEGKATIQVFSHDKNDFVGNSAFVFSGLFTTSVFALSCNDDRRRCQHNDDGALPKLVTKIKRKRHEMPGARAVILHMGNQIFLDDVIHAAVDNVAMSSREIYSSIADEYRKAWGEDRFMSTILAFAENYMIGTDHFCLGHDASLLASPRFRHVINIALECFANYQTALRFNTKTQEVLVTGDISRGAKFVMLDNRTSFVSKCFAPTKSTSALCCGKHDDSVGMASMNSLISEAAWATLEEVLGAAHARENIFICTPTPIFLMPRIGSLTGKRIAAEVVDDFRGWFSHPRFENDISKIVHLASQTEGNLMFLSGDVNIGIESIVKLGNGKEATSIVTSGVRTKSCSAVSRSIRSNVPFAFAVGPAAVKHEGATTRENFVEIDPVHGRFRWIVK